MKKQYAVIGLGRFGTEVARTLSEYKLSVVAVDKNENKVKDVADLVQVAVQLDATNEKAMREAGMENVDVAIVSIGEHIEASILVVMILRDLGVKHITAKAVSEMHGRILWQLGIKNVIHPERDMARKLAHNLVRPDILEQIELSSEYSVSEISAPEFLYDKSIMETKLRSEHGITVIAVKSEQSGEQGEQKLNINPSPSDIIKKGDMLVILGRNEDIEKFNGQK